MEAAATTSSHVFHVAAPLHVGSAAVRSLRRRLPLQEAQEKWREVREVEQRLQHLKDEVGRALHAAPATPNSLSPAARALLVPAGAAAEQEGRSEGGPGEGAGAGRRGLVQGMKCRAVLFLTGT